MLDQCVEQRLRRTEWGILFGLEVSAALLFAGSIVVRD